MRCSSQCYRYPPPGKPARRSAGQSAGPGELQLYPGAGCQFAGHPYLPSGVTQNAVDPGMLIVAGVGIQSLITLLTGSPITAVFAHISMHIAAVLYGFSSVVNCHRTTSPPTNLVAGRI